MPLGLQGISGGGGGGGTVTSFSFTNGGGFTGIVTSPTVNPTLSLTISDSRITSALLTGLAAGINTPILSTDTILAALANLQAEIDAVEGSDVDSVGGTLNRITASPTTGNVIVDISASYVGQSSITTVGTLTSGAIGAGFTVALGSSTITGVLLAANGGTGIANNAASTITISGAFGLTLSLSGTTSISLPTSGLLMNYTPTQDIDFASDDLYLTSLGRKLIGYDSASTWTLVGDETQAESLKITARSDGSNIILSTDITYTSGLHIFSGALTGASSYNGLVITPNTGVITTGTWSASTILANRGGTGFNSYVIGDILAANTTSTLSKIAAVATGNVLISGGVGVLPLWGQVSLTTAISGILPPSNGGTGIANNNASTLTITGAFASTFTVTGAFNYTLPTATSTLLASNLGITGGTVLIGDTAAGGLLILSSTSNVTKGSILLGASGAFNEALGYLGILTTVPNNPLSVGGLLTTPNAFIITAITTLFPFVKGLVVQGVVGQDAFSPCIETQASTGVVGCSIFDNGNLTTIGSIATTSTLSVTGHMALGGAGSISTTKMLNASEIFATTANALVEGMSFSTTLEATGGSTTHTVNGYVNTTLIGSNNTATWAAGAFKGQSIRLRTLGTNVYTLTDAIYLQLITGGFGTTKPTTLRGFDIQNLGISGITTSTAINIQAQSGATTNYAITSASGNLHGFGTTTPHSTLQFEGSFAGAYIAKTANYTATVSDYVINCTSNTFTITLPTAVGITGRIYIIKNSGSETITVDGNASETIDGNLTISLTQFSAAMIMSTNVGWIII